MGRLIKNHWARLIVLSAASYNFAASIHAYFWPKFMFDFYTKNFDLAVKPVPTLQTINLIFATFSLALEWPIDLLAGTSMHQSIEFRVVWYLANAILAVLLYQGINAGVCYTIGVGAWVWAYSEGEVVCIKPWTLPRRSDRLKNFEKG